MRIESIKLQNFKALQDVCLPELPPYCVFVGPNGSGKSTLFDSFGFLKDCLKNNVRSALQRRGGFREVVSRTKESERIVIELQFRMLIVGVERLVTYHLSIENKEDEPVIAREVLRYKRGRFGSPYHFLDCADCETGKEQLAKTCHDAGRADTLIRIPCRELESWYLGDLAAVEVGLATNRLRDLQQKTKFRDPDQINAPSQELTKIAPYQKPAGSRAIGPHLDPERNRSHSFQVFVSGLRAFVEGTKETRDRP